MTRAGDKLYREPDDMPGSVLWALVRNRQFRRGFRDAGRLIVGGVLIAYLLGLG